MPEDSPPAKEALLVQRQDPPMLAQAVQQGHDRLTDAATVALFHALTWLEL